MLETRNDPQSEGLREKVEAFILFNEREEKVPPIVEELGARGVTTFFWRRDIAFGDDWKEIESAALSNADSVLAFLGTGGWGPNHLRIAHEAISLGKRIIPVLIGDPSPDALADAGGLFTDRRYLELREISDETIDRLVAAIRQTDGPQPSPRTRDPQFDHIIDSLVNGNEEQRAATLGDIQGLSKPTKEGLAQRLRFEIEDRFSPLAERNPASAARDPKIIPSIRSWMLSSLIWSGAEAAESRQCILKHLDEDYESNENVRFWSLAGLYQIQASYLEEAATRRQRDTSPQVASLAQAILAPGNPELFEHFRSALKADDFGTVWRILRLLRIVPVPGLVSDVGALLGRSVGGTELDYDALYALSHPAMAERAGKVLSEDPGARKVIQSAISASRDSNRNAKRAFAKLLEQFNPELVQTDLREAEGVSETSLPAKDLLFLLGLPPAAQLESAATPATGEPRSTAIPPSTSPFAPAPYAKTFSRFASDSSVYDPTKPKEKLPDELGLGVYAGHLAQLIAAKETMMPLSVGLFGPWGSGKSYFIDLLTERLNSVSEKNGPVFHKHIVQIRFNAWHYLDSNLWANLVSEIFDQLFTKLEARADTTKDQVDKLKSELKEQGVLAAEANEALKNAKAARTRAEAELKVAIENRNTSEASLKNLLNNLASLAQAAKVTDQLKTVADGLGIPKLQTSLEDLRLKSEEVRSLGGRGKAIFLAIFTGPGWWVRFLLLVAALLIPLLISWLAEQGPQLARDLLGGIGKAIAQLVAAITALTTWIGANVKSGNQLVGKLEDAYEKVKEAQTKNESSEKVVAAQKALDQTIQSEEAAKTLLIEAETRVRTIQAEIDELAPGRQLIRFLKERASTTDYRQHLGLVSLVRKDFEKLSILLTNAAGQDSSLPQIDRIVLFIDDLDRCRADRVIEVLEAVHLLLAYRLFAVVVAVDPRWLRQSLLDTYPKLLGGSGGTDQNAGSRAVERPASPQDYLEKIFQVPFNLRPMEKSGFDALMRQLFPATAPKEPVPVDPPAKPTPSSPIPSPSPLVNPSSGAGTTSPPSAGNYGRNENPPTDSPDLPPPVTANVSPPPNPKPAPVKPPEVDPQRLELTAQEISDLLVFQPLFKTPRAVKRLANTYSLIRVGVDEAEWGNYVTGQSNAQNYRVPMLLLAVSAAFPSLARPYLSWIQEDAPVKWQLDERDIETLIQANGNVSDPEEWRSLATGLKLLPLDTWTPPSPDLIRKWAPRVERYSF